YDTTRPTQDLLTFDLNRLRVELGADDRAYRAPDRDTKAEIVQPEESWRNSRRLPTVLGKPVSNAVRHRNEEFRAFAVNRNHSFVLLGSSEFLRLISYDDGTPFERCREPIAEEAFRINVTPDGNYVVTGHGDGTLRWYRIVRSTNNRCRFELMLSVYLSETSPGNWSWAGWRPSGQFARDAAGRDSMEWQRIGRGDDIALTPFTRLLALYDWDALTDALAAGETVMSPEARRQIAQNQQVPLVSVLKTPPANKVRTEHFQMRLKIEDAGSWPKNLVIVMKSGRALAKRRFPDGEYLPPWKPLVLEPSNLQAGVVDLELELPASERTTNEPTKICFLIDDALNACEKFTWIGELALPAKRRLWAVLVGIARHHDPKLNLSFADNDALDIARQLIADFGKTNATGSSAPPDFQEIRLDLILSSRTPAGDAEAMTLQQAYPSYVNLHLAPTKGVVAEALEKAVAARAADRELSDDIFLFYFSGHGATIDGKLVLAMPQTAGNLDNWRDTALNSDDLWNMLRQIPGQRIAVLDACRTEGPTTAKLDPGRARTEFEGKVLSTFLFFSAKIDEASIEVPGLTFNTDRPADRQGNGLFTYAFIDGLNNRNVAQRDEFLNRDLIKLGRLTDYIYEFFGPKNRAALERLIPSARRKDGIPHPQ